MSEENDHPGGAMSVTAIYSIEAAEGKAEELLAVLKQGRDFSASVDGSEGFDVFQGKDDPHKFVMVEHWSSVEAQQAHFDANVKGAGVLDTAEALMTQPLPPPQESYYLLR
jgi:quinol monooxygenase YgiN